MPTTATPTIDDQALTASATALTEAFGLGDEVQTSTWWPGDDDDTVIAATVANEDEEGEMLLAVSADVGERLLKDKARFVAGLQKAADEIKPGLVVGDNVELVRRRAKHFAIISDRGNPCAIFAVNLAGAVREPDDTEAEEQAALAERRAAAEREYARGSAARESLLSQHDRLLDVDVTVAVELGRTTWSMAQLLDLQVGRIIELDRPVDLPVTMTANGTEVGEGHVVVVGQNFGLRLL